MNNITIGRFEADDAQGCIKPEDGSWQLVIDREGYPHLWVRVKLEEGGTGLLAVEEMMPTSIPDLMRSEFGGQLKPEEEEDAWKDYESRQHPPCPR